VQGVGLSELAEDGSTLVTWPEGQWSRAVTRADNLYRCSVPVLSSPGLYDTYVPLLWPGRCELSIRSPRE
jgi:hypothetical protein